MKNSVPFPFPLNLYFRACPKDLRKWHYTSRKRQPCSCPSLSEKFPQMKSLAFSRRASIASPHHFRTASRPPFRFRLPFPRPLFNAKMASIRPLSQTLRVLSHRAAIESSPSCLRAVGSRSSGPSQRRCLMSGSREYSSRARFSSREATTSFSTGCGLSKRSFVRARRREQPQLSIMQRRGFGVTAAARHGHLDPPKPGEE